MSPDRSRWPARAALAMTVAVLGCWGALGGARYLEADNAFCASCHLDGRPLHTRQFDQLANSRGGTLAAAHHTTVRVGGETRPMRCIDCHRGADRLGQARLDMIAVGDLFTHLTGQTDRRPEGVRLPVADAVCASCHTAIGGRFHTYTAHRGALTVRCVECHRGHAEGTGPVSTDPQHTRAQCARCHPGLADKVMRVAGGLPPDPRQEEITNP